MTFLLEHLTVPVVGYSLPAEMDSLYERAERTGAIPEVFADIRDYKTVESFIDLHKPSTIIHMAAQPLVLKSYESPRETFDVNVMGTVNVLDIAFKKDFVKAIIVVTTDKVYRNDNSGSAFVETDPLEGKDPYSASKVGTESVVAAWQQIAQVSGGPKVISVRAGNVIGGGDFAANRIIPDLIRGVMTNEPVEIRNPHSTRPWQHVLDPLHGYLLALESLEQLCDYHSVNFSPRDKSMKVKEVIDIVKICIQNWSSFKLEVEFQGESEVSSQMESSDLDLDSSFASKLLGWSPVYSQKESIQLTIKWWEEFLVNRSPVAEICNQQITAYQTNLMKFS